ncbi:molybdopterin-dependent oxidoreductase [Calidifontibacter terrae]
MTTEPVEEPRRHLATARLASAFAGVAATVLGAGAGHLVAGLVQPDASPPYAVGSVVIDATPTPVKEWAVSTFGTNDKPFLLTGIAVVTLLLAAVAGLIARRSFAVGFGFLALLVVAAGAAAMSRPTATAVSILPTLVTAIVGLAAFVLLHRTGEGGDGDLSRRGLLISGAAAAVGALGMVVGQSVAGAARIVGTLPRVRKPLAALPADIPVPGVTPLRTPNGSFYRVDTALVVPRITASDWSLVIDGEVENPQKFTYAEIMAMPLIESDVTLCCVSNEVGGGYAGGARWTGIPVRELLARATPKAGNDQVLSTSSDGYTSSTPLVALTDVDRGALLAVGMNGELLPREHGYPARLVTPGLYGYVGATKWVTRLTVTTYAHKKAYWTVRGWSEQGPVKPETRIDTPAPLATMKAGTVAIAGTAWAQFQGIRAVQVQIDDGPWQQARMGADVGIDYWRQWWFPWQATPGQHRLRARCIYGPGNAVQTATRADPFPNGASGIHEIAVIVR